MGGGTGARSQQTSESDLVVTRSRHKREQVIQYSIIAESDNRKSAVVPMDYYEELWGRHSMVPVHEGEKSLPLTLCSRYIPAIDSVLQDGNKRTGTAGQTAGGVFVLLRCAIRSSRSTESMSRTTMLRELPQNPVRVRRHDLGSSIKVCPALRCALSCASTE